MIHKDYLLEIVAKFVEAVLDLLRTAVVDGDVEAAKEAEDAVAALLDLDPQTAMMLSPDSLVTMMLLTGMGDGLAGHVAYVLDRVGDAYDAAGDETTAQLRWDQAQAVADAFGCDLDDVPKEFQALDDELAEQDGE
jgi:hypothetical protein